MELKSNTDLVQLTGPPNHLADAPRTFVPTRDWSFHRTEMWKNETFELFDKLASDAANGVRTKLIVHGWAYDEIQSHA